MSAAKKPAGDVGEKQVQEKADKEIAVGYEGTKVDPLPNSAHSLQSGPDAPSFPDDNVSRIGQVNIDTRKEG